MPLDPIWQVGLAIRMGQLQRGTPAAAAALLNAQAEINAQYAASQAAEQSAREQRDAQEARDRQRYLDSHRPKAKKEKK